MLSWRRLIAPTGHKDSESFRCLKAGVNPEFPEQGTPQGWSGESPTSQHCAQWDRGTSTSLFSYADDMIIILKPKDDAEAIPGIE